MRTSRISRETTRVVNALSSQSNRKTSERRSLRGFAHAPESPPESQTNEADSDLSEPPSSPETTSSTRNGTLGKRKRGNTATPATSVTAISEQSTDVRRSPRKAVKVEDDGTTNPKSRRQPAKKIKSEDGSIVVQPPTNWEEVYNITTDMRKRVLAPVDTMGCESLAEEQASPRDKRLQTLIALMLSSQTKDTVTAVAMKNLQEGLPGGFNLEALLNVEPPQLNSLINKVGFHNNKTKYIKSVAPILRDQFSGDIPDTIEGLVSLPGVGPKMAYLCMSSAWGRDEGIGVDVHVHRITNLWRWHKTSNPEQTRAELESWLPKEKWHDINHLLVGFGQTICLPVGRKCGECELSARKLCPSAVAGSPKKIKQVKEVEIKVEDDKFAKEEERSDEVDDAGAKVHIKSEDLGDVETSAHIPDIEDLAGR